MENQKRSFFEALTSKQAFGLGFVAAVLIIGTIGCLVLGSYVWKGGGSDNTGVVVGQVYNASVKSSNTAAASTSESQTNSSELFKKIATEVGLDTKVFDSCLLSDKTLVNIQADQKSASVAGVKGTPASFIIGKDGVAKQVKGGAVSQSAMEALIDQALGNSISGTPATTIDVTGTLAPITSDDYVYGDVNAPITIVTYSDFQCPYCGRFDSTMQQVMKDFSGKVKWVYRNFPLPFHDQAQNAAEAAECAGEQGKFWEYAFKLFENQSAL